MIKLTDEQKTLAKALTTLQKKYVINLVGKSMSQREAYIAAGGTAKGESSQDNGASVLLSNSKVRAFYDSLMASAASGAVLTKQRALEILSRSVTATVADFCKFEKDEDGSIIMMMKNPSELPEDLARCIKSITPHGDSFKLELHDSHGAMKQMADMIGWNVPRKTKISGDEDAPIEHTMTVTFVDAATKK